MSDTVKIGYSAFSNITFRGEYDTGIPREEWDEMDEKGQWETMNELLTQDVDLWVKEDGEKDNDW